MSADKDPGNDPDLSHLSKAIKNDAPKKVALDEWNELAEAVLINSTYIKRTKSGMAPVQLYYNKLLKAREAIKNFEITKHRTIVDAIIGELKALETEHNGTHILRFAKRMSLRARIEATKATLLVVVNTTPPKQPQPKKA